MHKAQRFDVQANDFVGFMYDESASTGIVAWLDQSESGYLGYSEENMPLCFRTTLWRSEAVVRRDNLVIRAQPDKTKIPLLRAFVTTDGKFPLFDCFITFK